MSKLDYFSGLLLLAGLLMHFLASWGEYWRGTAKVSPWAFVLTDPPGWLFALVAGLVSYAVLPQLGPVLGVEPPLGAVAAGYMASSLGNKLSALGERK